MKFWHSLEGKSVWVVGGAGYLGSAITQALDRQCQKVICIDLEKKASALVRQKQLTQTIPVTFDVSPADGIEPFIARTIRRHGVPDGLVYLAFASSTGKRLEDLSQDDFQRTFDLALPSTFVFCRGLAERMKPQGSGSIVLFASMYGMVPPDPRLYHAPNTPNPIDYGACKAAILQMTRYFAVHYGPAGIRFNSVTPGPFPNPAVQSSQLGFIRDLSGKTALRRIGQNHEIVGPTLFLLTDSASFVTGHSLVVDGGWTIW